MRTRNILYADEGEMLTDGEVYGKIIYLADDMSTDRFYGISEQEYERIMAEQDGDGLD